MKRRTWLLAGILGAAIGFGTASAADEMIINGSGASFPYPIYAKWADKYNTLTGVKINYQSVGSGAGIAAIKAKTVTFAGSDAPLKKEELDQAGLVQFPLIMGGVVPIVNIPGIEPGQLKLAPGALVDIYLGKITKWDDPAIKVTNPDLALPDSAIKVVHRSDGSGTSWIFTGYLDKISVEWHEKVGWDKAVKWPAGIGGKGNEGVAANVKTIPGTIGYVEYAYAIENKLCHTQLRNRDGKFLDPNMASFAAAAANANWKAAPGMFVVLVDQPGEKSWPIAGASYILMYKEQAPKDKAQIEALLKFFDWCFAHGADMAQELHYVAVPADVADVVRGLWRASVTCDGAPILK